jgi:hypothetical protein
MEKCWRVKFSMSVNVCLSRTGNLNWDPFDNQASIFADFSENTPRSFIGTKARRSRKKPNFRTKCGDRVAGLVDRWFEGGSGEGEGVKGYRECDSA